MVILNIGCGKKQRKDSINVDFTKYDGVDEVVDLSKYPWKWKDNSIDGIHASHVIEHLPDQKQFILECYRILKPGGFLRLSLPHASNITAVGCMGHYRTYSYNTLKDYLSRDFYMFEKALFRTVEQKLLWWHESVDCQGDVPMIILPLIYVFNPVFNFIAKLSPKLCENIVCSFIQYREVIWKGVKI